jgi:chromosome segregation ATPase
MTTQEILASLSSLEQELNDIKAARVLAEDTITSYKEIKSEIQKFFSEFQLVTASLNTVADAFKSSKTSLYNDVQKSIKVANAQIETLSNAFNNQCDAAVSHFVESLNQSATKFKQTTLNLTNDYVSNNKSFKDNITDLSKLKTSLITASNSLVSLKQDITTLQSELKSSQDNQIELLEKIASDFKRTNDSQTQIMNQLSEDLKESQKAQDDDLSNIKDKVTAIAESQHNHEAKTDTAISNIASAKAAIAESQRKHEAKTDTAISNIASAKTAIEGKLSTLESQILDMNKNVNSVKTIGIINIIAIIIVAILMFVK